MNRFLAFVKVLELSAIAFLCISLGLLGIHADRTLTRLNQTLNIVNINMVNLSDGVQATLANVNRACGTGRPCGTLADIAKTLGTIRNTAGQIEIAANHEDKRLTVLDAQETNLYRDTHNLLQRGSVALDTTNKTIAGLQPVENNLNEEAKQLNTATVNLNALISDPDIRTAIGNANSSLGHINATVADTQEAVHKWLHPTWPRKVWNGIQSFSVDLGKIFL